LLLEDMARLSLEYSKRVKEEEKHTPEEIEIMNVGKIDPKKHLENDVNEILSSSIIQCLGTMIDTVVF
jgi:26S proteasome regulatory subunit N11